jgi:hypothetical protein
MSTAIESLFQPLTIEQAPEASKSDSPNPAIAIETPKIGISFPRLKAPNGIPARKAARSSDLRQTTVHRQFAAIYKTRVV